MTRPFVVYALSISLAVCSLGQNAFPPPPPDADTVESLLTWSAPDRGLVVRVDHFEPYRKHQPGSVYIRFKNQGDEPVHALTGRLHGSLWIHCFELHLWDGQRWRPGFWSSTHHISDEEKPALVELQPGESSVVVLSARVPDEVSNASHFKLRINLPYYKDASDRTLNRTEYQAPPYPVASPAEVLASKRDRLELPSHLPYGIKDHDFFGLLGNTNSGGEYSTLFWDWRLYDDMIRYFDLHSDTDVAARLAAMIGVQVAEDEGVRWHLLVATLSAMRGGEDGIHFLTQQLESDDYEVIRSAIFGLRQVAYQEPNPAWAADRLLDLLTDQRPIVIPEDSSLYVEPGEWWFTEEELVQAKKNADPYTLPLQQIAIDNDVALTMGHIKYKPAVDHLLQTLEIDDAFGVDEGIDAIWALGQIGDRQAIQPLLELLRTEAETATYQDDFGSPQRFRSLVSSLAELDAIEAVPLLLNHLEHPCVADALRDIGDPSAIPALREFLIESLQHRLDPNQRDAAKLALIVLEDSDVVSKLSAFINDPGVDTYSQTDAIRVLAAAGDPRAVPPLLDVIRSHPEGSHVSTATWALHEFPSRAAVEGLVDCLNIDFSSREPWKPAHSADDFKDDIASALRTLTGQHYGSDFETWNKWVDLHADAYFASTKQSAP